MRVLDLFSGIGGFHIGAERAGFETIYFCERDEFCRKVLAKHWPHIPVATDVQHFIPLVPADIICGGFPCQDASVANTSGEGIEGARTGLWKEIKRLAAAIRPKFVVLENVPGLLGRGFGTVLGDLAEIGYDAEWRCIRASLGGAPHRRDRLWLVAYPRGTRLPGYFDGYGILGRAEAAFAEHGDEAFRTWYALVRDIPVLRGRDGVPVASHRLRVKSAGNSLAPAMAEAIFKEIRRIGVDTL